MRGLILAWKRPQYLARTLKSLERVEGISEWFAHIDGEGHPKVKKLLKESKLKPKIFEASKNEGVVNALIRCESVFKEKVMYFEEDVLMSENAVNLALNLEKIFGLIPVISPIPGEPKGELNEVVIGGAYNFIGRIWTPEDYNTIFDELKAYGKVIKKKQDRVNNKDWIKERFQVNNPAADCVISKLVKREIVKLRRTRAIHIGEHGHNTNPGTFSKRGWKDNFEINFPEDKHRKDFRVWKDKR